MQVNFEQLQDIFSDMIKDGFDIKAPLKWSFYFVDNEKSQLEKLYDELKDHDYKIERLDQNDENEWTLQVSKKEVLTPEKLHKRNIAFNELADYYVKLYDGWDVEKI
jgi:hypothetical protein